MVDPLVSIVCDVYNHEPFLRKCLDGFIMQKTDFPFEILIHDDASTDHSAEIIREYESLRPDLFRPIYETENQYFKQHLWADIQFPRAKGKYIAICEGDDYWTDELKLQKQVDYMESHPDCTICCHNALEHWYDNSHPDVTHRKWEDRDYTAEEIIKETWTPVTASLLFRSALAKGYGSCMKKYPGIIIGDIPLLLYYSREGHVHGMKDVMCTYGKHRGGWTLTFDAKKMYSFAYSWEMTRKAFYVPYAKLLASIPIGVYLNACSYSIKEKNAKVLFLSLYRGIIRHPFDGIKALIRLPKERRKRKKNSQEYSNERPK